MELDLYTIADRLDGTISGAQVCAPGPGRAVGDDSLIVQLDPRAPDGLVVRSLAGDDPAVCREYVRKRLGMDSGGLNRDDMGSAPNAIRRRTVATYDYRDEAGQLRFQVVRQEPKTFLHRSPDPAGADGWTSNLDSMDPVPFRLPELIEAVKAGRTVYVAEGEKDVLTLVSLGLDATTNPGGPDAWPPNFASYFEGAAHVVILADADEPGRAHAQAVAKNLAPVVERIQVVEMPDGAKDVSEWIEAGHTAEELSALIDAAPTWQPAASRSEVERNDQGLGHDEAAVIELAAMHPLERAKKRQEVARKLGIGLGVLDQAIREVVKANAERNQPERLLRIVESEAELYHARDGSCFADIRVNGHRETWPLKGQHFKNWLARRFYDETEKTAKAEALRSALSVIEAKAQFSGEQRDVYVRVGDHGGNIYIDLGDETWRAIEVTPTGWQIVADPPVRFRRPAGMKALPVPEHGGRVEMLRPYLNLQTDRDFILIVAWLLQSLRPHGPYPILSLTGEQGSAKTTHAAIFRALVDPNAAALRALPRVERDLFIAATNGHVLAFDNLSGIPASASDALCRLATGGALSVRQLYSDQGETLLEAQRPIILTGITDYVERPDLADRALLVKLEPIPEAKRLSERTLWEGFRRDQPLILGALLNIVAHGLAALPDVKLAQSPRMADFCEWAAACEGALWPPGTFMRAYQASLADAAQTVIEADPVAQQIRRFMERHPFWKGTASELLSALNGIAPEGTRRMRGSNGWPTAANHLSGRVRRAAPVLRKTGVGVSFTEEGHANKRYITLTSLLEEGADGPLASLAHADDPKDRGTSEGTLVGDIASGASEAHAAPSASGRDHASRANELADPLDRGIAREKSERSEAPGLGASDPSDGPSPNS